MFTQVDTAKLPDNVSRQEREHFEEFQKDLDNPAKRHRLPITAYVNGKRVHGFFEEPTEAALLSAASELLPIWTRSQIFPACMCGVTYYRAKSTLDMLTSCTSTLQVTEEALQQIKKDPDITRAVSQRLKVLKGQIFFTREEVQTRLLEILTDVLSPDQVSTVGLAIVAYLQELGVNEDLRQQRMQEQRDILTPFCDLAPIRSSIPTEEPCPFCHLPRQYTFIEWIPYELPALLRAIELLVGVSVPLTEIPRIIEALELWFFAADDGLFAKKNQIQTITGAAMTHLLTIAKQSKDEIMSLLGSPDGGASNETDASSSVLDGPPPSIPDD